MKCLPTELPGVCVLEPKIFRDDRGAFMETFNHSVLAGVGLRRDWVQDNQSHSIGNVLRGLHHQLRVPQAKLVRVLSGTIFDVAVDIRQNSPSFGRWVGVELSADNSRMLFIPEGFAHGFYVMSQEADVAYKCSTLYSPADERGLIWNDPAIDIDWPIPSGETPLLSPKDSEFPGLAGTPTCDLPRTIEAAA